MSVEPGEKLVPKYRLGDVIENSVHPPIGLRGKLPKTLCSHEIERVTAMRLKDSVNGLIQIDWCPNQLADLFPVFVGLSVPLFLKDDLDPCQCTCDIGKLQVNLRSLEQNAMVDSPPSAAQASSRLWMRLCCASVMFRVALITDWLLASGGNSELTIARVLQMGLFQGTGAELLSS